MSRITRVGVVQWSMEGLVSADALLERVDFHIDALAGYGCHFVLFPEWFAIPLLAEYDTAYPRRAIRHFAARTPVLLEHVSRKAVSAGVSVVAGSFPELQGDRLLNVAYLCAADGSVYRQPKLHPTPNERAKWHMDGGDALRVIDTPHGRVAILICYDIEFPELSRLLSLHRVDIVFVPSWTDLRPSWLRVRTCAQARAIENECYVAVAGSTGTVMNVVHANYQYTQSVVFSPCDLVFPAEGIIAEAEPNIPQTLIADLDLDKLSWLRDAGAVRNGRDRRPDLYELVWKGPSSG